jgi:DNA-binding response OmpR family regulator
MRVLVVDDEPDVIEVVRLTFNLHWPEAEVPPAPAGSESVELPRKLGNGPAGAPMIVNERGVGYEFVRRDRAPSRAGREGCGIR